MSLAPRLEIVPPPADSLNEQNIHSAFIEAGWTFEYGFRPFMAHFKDACGMAIEALAKNFDRTPLHFSKSGRLSYSMQSERTKEKLYTLTVLAIQSQLDIPLQDMRKEMVDTLDAAYDVEKRCNWLMKYLFDTKGRALRRAGKIRQQVEEERRDYPTAYVGASDGLGVLLSAEDTSGVQGNTQDDPNIQLSTEGPPGSDASLSANAHISRASIPYLVDSSDPTQSTATQQYTSFR